MISLSVILLAVAVSFDALAIGITYGMNRVTIPLGSKLVLSVVSGFSLYVAMVLGWFLEQHLNPSFAAIFGGVIFILLGIHNLWRSYRTEHQRVVLDLRIPVLGLIIQVLQEPLRADSDHSQHIAGAEAIILGGALALDALAAGFGAAILGLPLVPTTLAVMLASFVFIAQGLKTGARLTTSPNQSSALRWLPGAIICGIGLIKILF